MKYLPFENITYRTNLDSEEVVRRIEKELEPSRGFRFIGLFSNDDHKLYEGGINGRTFRMKRIIGYRNSFLPRINGEIQESDSGTRIKIKMSLHPLVLIFMIIWCGFVGLVFLGAMAVSVSKRDFQAVNLIPLGMFLFGYGLTFFAFKFESQKSKEYFSKIFEVEN